jgi:hypothetical protein
MKHPAILAIAILLAANLIAPAAVEKPTDTCVFPAVPGWAGIRVWDATAGAWVVSETRWQPTSFDFSVPQWNRWYWIGLWDFATGQWVSGQWLAHFVSP